MWTDGHTEHDDRSEFDRAIDAATDQLDRCAEYGFEYDQPTCRSILIRGHGDERAVTFRHDGQTIIGLVDGEQADRCGKGELVGRRTVNAAMRQLYDTRERQPSLIGGTP